MAVPSDPAKSSAQPNLAVAATANANTGAVDPDPSNGNSSNEDISLLDGEAYDGTLEQLQAFINDPLFKADAPDEVFATAEDFNMDFSLDLSQQPLDSILDTPLEVGVLPVPGTGFNSIFGGIDDDTTKTDQEVKMSEDPENPEAQPREIVPQENVEAMDIRAKDNDTHEEHIHGERPPKRRCITPVGQVSPDHSRPPTPEDYPESEASMARREHRFNLRHTIRDQSKGYGSWIDHDQSGTYDPSQKAPVPPPPKTRVKGTPRQTSGDEQHPRKESRRSLFAHRMLGDRLCITLKVPGERGRQLLMKYPGDNWPDDAARNAMDMGYAADESSSDPDQRRALRRRRSGLLDEFEEENLTGHPEGRGCKTCRSTGVECSMLHPAGGYPCDVCFEDGEECELLVPAVRKQSCESCRKKGRACSYAYPGSDHSRPCEYCMHQNFKCIAGPDMTGRGRLDEEGNIVVPEDRSNRYQLNMPKSCWQCRNSDNACSLKEAEGPPPCNSCLKVAKLCTLKEPPREQSMHQVSVQKQSASADQEANKENELAAAEKPVSEPSSQPQKPKLRGTIGQLRTSLSHPITFNSMPNAPDLPCHWCGNNKNPFLPLYGHAGGPRDVKVLFWADKRGCKELQNGYTNTGHEPCRMCALCTFFRVKIMFCRNHTFRAVVDVEKELLTEAQKSAGRARGVSLAMKHLGVVWKQSLDLEVSERCDIMRKELGKWCAICPNVASYGCCAGGGGKDLGCGLRLCSVCHALVSGRATYGGNLVRFVKEIQGKMQSEPNVRKFYPKGLRADFDFFSWDGFMMRQVRAVHFSRTQQAKPEQKKSVWHGPFHSRKTAKG